MIGKDENFDTEASNEEKANRVIAILETIENLNLVVKGNLDNAEPIFVVGGLSNRKTHIFENVVKVKKGKLLLTEDFLDKINLGYDVALLRGENLENENEIIEKLNPTSVTKFFGKLKQEIKEYYGI
jgi:CRISPR-associated protein Cst2